MRLTVTMSVLGLMGLTGCAHTPDTGIYYFPARTMVEMKITRTIGCSSDNQLFSSQNVETAIQNQADITNPISLKLDDLNSRLADTTFEATFYDDGRLKGINATVTGKGGEIVKSAISLAKIVVGLPGFDGPPPVETFPKLCALIAKEKDKLITLKYARTFDPSVSDGGSYEWAVLPTQESQYFFLKAQQANANINPLSLTVTRESVSAPNVPKIGKADGGGITFKYPAAVLLGLSSADTPLWHDTLFISQLGSDGWLPIAGAPAFGKNTTVIDLAEDGSLTKVSYGAESGTKAALDAAHDAIDLIDGKTDAEIAAEAEAEMKRIKAERELLKCIADPDNC